MNSSHSVLIVDSCSDNRAVLKSVLENRGHRIWEASAAEQGLQLARQHRPDLIVLDLECEQPQGAQVSAAYAAQSAAQQKPLVLLGSVRCQVPQPAGGQFVSKPYHYGPLIRKIEELLATAEPPARRAA